MDIYRYGIVVEYAKPWNIIKILDNLHTDCARSQDGKYWYSADREYWYSVDGLDKDPMIDSGTDENLGDYKCIRISRTIKDETDINIKELQNKVKDLYIQELQNTIKNCNEAINKMKRN